MLRGYDLKKINIGSTDYDIESKLNIIDRKVTRLEHSDYLYVKTNIRSMLWYNFLIGLARGLGMAIGFTLLGAVIIYILQKVVLLHLPGISHALSDIIKYIQLFDKK